MRRLMSMVQTKRFDPTTDAHAQLQARSNRGGVRPLWFAQRWRPESRDSALSTGAAVEKSAFRGGLRIRQLHKVEDYLSERLAEEISVEAMAELVELSPFHFSPVFKQTTQYWK